MSSLSEYSLNSLFSFDKGDITRHMMYELKLTCKFKDSFEYLCGKLPVQEVKPLSEIKWDEGKNYDWAIINDGLVTLIIRHYQTHFTIFFKNENKENEYRTRHGCFTFYSNTGKMEDWNSDMHNENNFIGLDACMKDLLKLILDGNIQCLWNPYSFKRPEYVEVKNIWDGGDMDISSIDDFIYCCDELFSKHLEKFAETEMLDRLKTIKVDDMLGVYKVISVNTEIKDDYYHSAGLKLKNTNFKDSKEDWCDVYSLTRYYLYYVFPELNNKELNQ